MILRSPGNLSPVKLRKEPFNEKDIKLKTDLSSIINILKDNYSKPPLGMGKFLSPISDGRQIRNASGRSQYDKAQNKVANSPMNMSFDINSVFMPKIETHPKMKT